MSIIVFEKCWRGYKDCCSFQAIDSPPEGISDEDRWERNYTPTSFVCCGQNTTSTLPQDAYRLCFKNDVVDEVSDNDEQDLTHILAVVAHALAVIATEKVNSGFITVPTAQGSDEAMNAALAAVDAAGQPILKTANK